MGKNGIWDLKNPRSATLQCTFRTDRENARTLRHYNVKNVHIFCVQQRGSGPEQQRSPLHQIHSSTLSESIQASIDIAPVFGFSHFLRCKSLIAQLGLVDSVPDSFHSFYFALFWTRK
jgi:hypothetical protein